jgi:hypothetical protein
VVARWWLRWGGGIFAAMRIFNICACVLGGAFLLSVVLGVVGLAVGGYAVCFIFGLAGLVVGAVGGLVLGIINFK